MEDYNLSQTGQQVQKILDDSYSKPFGGIPKSDLTEGIRTSLEHADAAYTQSAVNARAIETLRALYEALQGSDPEIIEPSDTWPVADPSQNVIYRVVDRVNTLPQYYTDYMWNGTTMVEMAQYDNAIDDEPAYQSGNLVKSGGIWNETNIEIPIDVTMLDDTKTINSSKKWSNAGDSSGWGKIIPITPGGIYKITTTTGCIYCLLKSLTNYDDNGSVDFCEDYNSRYTMSANESVTLVAPEDAAYLYITKKTSNGIRVWTLTEYVSVGDTVENSNEETNSFVQEKVGKNIFKPSITPNRAYTNAGRIVESDVYGLSDYLPVVEGTTYHFSCYYDGAWINRLGSNSTDKCIIMFDENKDFVGYVLSRVSELTIPSGVAYIRASLYMDATYVQIEEGNARTEYEPYNPVGGYLGTVKSAIKKMSENSLVRSDIILTNYPARDPFSETTSGYFKGYTFDLTGLYEKGFRFITFEASTYELKSSSQLVAGEILDSENNVISSIRNTVARTNSWLTLPITSTAKRLYASRCTSSSGGTILIPSVIYLSTGGTDISQLEKDVEQLKFPQTFLPDKVYGVIGDTQQLFVRGIVFANNPYELYNKFTCGQGKVYTRYLEITPALSGGVVPSGLTIKHRLIDNYNNKSAEKTADYVIAARPTTSPVNNINVLCVGASTTAGGQWPGELKRRLTGTLGSGTPAADGLTNITFVGRKNGSSDSSVKVEATGGWTWRHFILPRDAIRFYVTGFSSADIGAIYKYKDSNNADVRVIVAEVNVTGDTGNVLFTFDTSNHNAPAAAAGTMTKVSGSGDGTITYTSHDPVESYAPFYDPTTEEADFSGYAHEYCNDHIDVAIFDLGNVNAGIYGDFSQAQLDTVMEYMKTTLDALHADFPDCKVILSAGGKADTHNGMEYNYGAGSKLTTQASWWGKLAYINAVQDFIKQNDYKDWCFLSNVLAETDSEYVYPTAQKAVNTRMSTPTETIGTNGQHPTNAGYYQKADSIYRCFVNVILNQ